jgi:fatty-acyl-CoA synthase
MQPWPLVTGSLLRHAARHHGGQTLVSIGVDGVRTEQTLLETYGRSIRLALALERLSAVGEVVATLAWNTHRHVEAWHAVQNSGRVLHTLNPRLFLEQLAYIATEGEDVVLLVDADLVTLAEQLVAKVGGIRAVVVLASREQMPRGSGACKLLCYEDLLAAERLPANVFNYPWAGQDENAPAAMCFTSGTTGNPKVRWDAPFCTGRGRLRGCAGYGRRESCIRSALRFSTR